MSWIGLTLLGCSETVVTLQGTVYQSVDPVAPPLAQAELLVVDVEGVRLAEAVTDDDGKFELSVVGGDTVFVEITAEGYAVSTFPGVVGIQPVQVVEDGALYGVSEEVRAQVLAEFAGCPGTGEDQAIVLGELRLDMVDAVTGGSPTINTGIAEVLKSGQSEWLGCYLGEAGVYDPEATWTGETGRFLVGGVEPGLYDLAVSAQIVEGVWTEASYPLWIPDRPHVVSPWYPAWVPFEP
jgi:hypothetical protein